MKNQVRPEVSKRSKYFIEKHRYYELKHFCLQYKSWKESLNAINILGNSNRKVKVSNTEHSDPTANIAIAKQFYTERIESLESLVKEADADISRFILIGVTEDISYDVMSAKFHIPCSRETYYDRYRKFFYLLDKYRK